MRRVPFLFLAITIATSATARGAAPATTSTSPAEEKQPTLAEVKAKEQQQTTNEWTGLPVVNVHGIEDIFTLAMVGRDLRIATKMEPVEDALVSIPNMPGLSRVKFNGRQDPNGKYLLLAFGFENRDFTAPGAVGVFTSVNYTVGNLQIEQMWDTIDDQTYHVTLMQHENPNEGDPPVSLFVQITSPPAVDVKVNAHNIAELRRDNAALMAKYVDPILTTLKQPGLLTRVDPKLAWQVFGDVYQPPAELVEKVNALVKQLNADDFPQREAASKELERLGQPAVLVVRKIDRAGLSDEQKTRLDAFTSKFKTVTEAEAAMRRADPDFLLDCLYSDDAFIRAQALEALSKVMGKTIAFDINAAPEKRLEAIGKLRETIGTKGKTAPAEDGATTRPFRG
jgi:hypothetical protein